MSCACPTCGQNVPRIEALKMDLDTGVLLVNESAISFTPKQAEMMASLLNRYPAIVSKGVLMDDIYGSVFDHPHHKVLTVMTCKINQRLRGSGLKVRGVWGRGLRLEVDASVRGAA